MAPLRDPITGRFMKSDRRSVKKMERAGRAKLRRARSAVNKARKKVAAGAKKPETRRRYNRELRRAEKELSAIAPRVDAARQIEAETRRKKPISGAIDELYREWEFGVSYRPERRGNRGGLHRHVNFNIRVTSARKMSLSEIKKAITTYAQEGREIAESRHGVEITGVDWSRPAGKGERETKSKWGGVRYGTADDADAFSAIVGSELFSESSGLRVGPVRSESDWWNE